MWSDFIRELTKNSEMVLNALMEHIEISAVSIFLGILVAVPLGIFLVYHRKLAKVVLSVLGVINTLPSIVLLGLAMIFLGIGSVPAIAVLFLYSLLPIVRGTFTGICEVNPRCIKAAKGMGMNRMQMLWLVQLPLALPAIVTGIRLSAVYIISWATLAAFIGGGGLGDPIWLGLQSYNFGLMLCGALPATILALSVSALLNFVVKVVGKHKGGEVIA